MRTLHELKATLETDLFPQSHSHIREPTEGKSYSVRLEFFAFDPYSSRWIISSFKAFSTKTLVGGKSTSF